MGCRVFLYTAVGMACSGGVYILVFGQAGAFLALKQEGEKNDKMIKFDVRNSKLSFCRICRRCCNVRSAVALLFETVFPYFIALSARSYANPLETRPPSIPAVVVHACLAKLCPRSSTPVSISRSHFMYR